METLAWPAGHHDGLRHRMIWKGPEAIRHCCTNPQKLHKTVGRIVKFLSNCHDGLHFRHFCISRTIVLLPEAPHALSLHWSKKIPLGPSFPESSVSQNFLPVSSCYRRQRTKKRSSLNQKGQNYICAHEQAQLCGLPKNLLKTTGTKQNTGIGVYANHDKARTLKWAAF